MISELSKSLQRQSFDVEMAARCEQFLNQPNPKYLMGINAYAEQLLNLLPIQGIIDEFTKASTYKGIPILKLNEISSDAHILVLSAGRPLTVRNKLEAAGLFHIGYFSFLKYSGFELKPILFCENFHQDYARHRTKYDWIRSRLADHLSAQQFDQLIQFKLSYDLKHLEGFVQNETGQYFEPFLKLQTSHESFADIGAFDGQTSQLFAQHCPDYDAIHVFEPVPSNMELTKACLNGRPNTVFYEIGLSHQRESLRFNESGSCSTNSSDGTLTIQTDRMDDVLNSPLTYLKMDIEGAEYNALRGACSLIKTHHPRLAICVYHAPEDMWRIPELVLSIREDYDVYLRHYTESVYETVMYFTPKQTA